MTAIPSPQIGLEHPVSARPVVDHRVPAQNLIGDRFGQRPRTYSLLAQKFLDRLRDKPERPIPGALVPRLSQRRQQPHVPSRQIKRPVKFSH
jgi:hypothetical protein